MPIHRVQIVAFHMNSGLRLVKSMMTKFVKYNLKLLLLSV
ncbi:hypothetical protein CES85_3915 [Ochrobactrum quorumnocens]|uniref:Uncharacterized protein n=1 Tax=Ochrobactrum quorumnocens TaxID=271865 RepID=A0A248U9V1_9HYPH|nr:hypothetical protein CES85_3915 [[Ochrobactrum] quorumnocens]